MMYKLGFCSSPTCTRKGEVPIVNVSRKLCYVCNRKRLDEGKIAKPGTKFKLPKKIYKPHHKPVAFDRRKLIKGKRQATGERNFFAHEWEIRPHICTNCKIHLGNEPLAHFFAHILSKKQRPDLRLEPTNLMILCMSCHTAYDHGTKAQFAARTITH